MADTELSKALSFQLVNGFLEQEFAVFKKLYRDPNASLDEQDLRSLSMLWVCKFLNPFVNAEYGKRVHDFVEEVMNEEDYNYYGWERISSLQAISYLFTENKDHLNDLVLHISCGQSVIRPVILRSCGIIIDVIPATNNYFKKSAEKNIQKKYGYFEESTLLYLSSSGGWKEKKRWYLALKKHEQYHKVFLDRLQKKCKFYKNGFYLNAFSEAKSYFIFKVVTDPALGSFQSEILASDSDNEILLNTLRKFEKEHPLTGYYIDLSFLKNDNFGLFSEK